MDEELKNRIARGRGAVINPTDRFSAARYVPEETDEQLSAITEIREETVKSALSKNDSPDIPFTYSVNPYRGCEQGCVYCYARPTHEYLGMSIGLDFETKLIAKTNIAQMLRAELSKPSWTPEPIAFSGVTDPYQPIERKMGLARQCLEVFAETRNPVIIITKNALLQRDLDLLRKLNEYRAVLVAVSVTSVDPVLASRLEPRASHPVQRLKLVSALSEAGIPVGVMMAPIIPGLNDEEIADVLKGASEAGAQFASYVMLRLPHGLDDLFCRWLATHYPEREKRVLALIRQIRGGGLKDPRFGVRMKGEGVYAEQIGDLFAVHSKRLGLTRERTRLSTDHFQRPARPKKSSSQLELF